MVLSVNSKRDCNQTLNVSQNDKELNALELERERERESMGDEERAQSESRMVFINIWFECNTSGTDGLNRYLD